VSYDFLSGLVAAGYFVATLFFLRFRRRTGERIFGWFAGGFAVLGLQPVTGWVLVKPGADEAELYVIRLVGFCLIIIGVAVANRRLPVRPGPDQP
jgi:heme A synthase